MVTVLITSFLLLVVITFAIYRWQRTASSDSADHSLSPSPDFEGLFADRIAKEQLTLNAAKSRDEQAEKKRVLLTRASESDRSALAEAHQTGDAELYDEVLNALVHRAENEKQVLALASDITRSSDLTVNATLARAIIESWKHSPDRHTTAKMLHIVALAGDAALYLDALGLIQKFKQDQLLKDVTSEELLTLIESEFWLIPSSARNSGAGFLLKRELAKLRRELAARR